MNIKWFDVTNFLAGITRAVIAYAAYILAGIMLA